METPRNYYALPNRLRTAQQLGMSRAALYDRLARWPELGHKRQDRPG